MSDELSALDRWLDTDDEDEAPAAATSEPASAAREEPPAPEPEAEVDEPLIARSGEDRGDGRDAQGRFVGKDGESKEAAEGADAAAGAADATAPAVDGAPPAVQGEAQAAEPEVPFTFRAVGQELFVPGSKVTKDGVLIGQEGLELVSKYLGMGVKLEAERAEIKRAKFEMQMERAANEAFAKEADALMQIAQVQDDQQFAEAWLAYGLELRGKVPLLQQEMALSKREAALRLQEVMHQPDPMDLREQDDRVVQDDIKAGVVEELRQLPELNAMTDADWRELQAIIAAEPGRFYYKAGRELRPEEIAAGIQPGQVVRIGERIVAEARRINRYRAEAKAETERARKAAEDAQRVAEQNAKKLAGAQPRASAPTSVPRKAPPRAVEDDEDDMSFEALKREFAPLVRGA